MRLRSATPVLAMILACACSSPETTPKPPENSCAAAPAGSTTSFAAADVGVYVESGGDPGLDVVRADVSTYLGRLWSGSFPAAATAPTIEDRLTVWFSTSADAAGKAGLDADHTYAIRRVDDSKGTTVVVAAHDAPGLAYGAYAFLEQLGARFFHPKEELVPNRGGVRVPKALSLTRAPAMAKRGIQFHTLHPIEYFAPFNQPSDDNLADAKRVIDWLVKTGQNYVQWALLSTVDWEAFRPHAQAIIDYAHQRGVKVGANVQVWGGASLQNNYILVHDQTDWQAQMDQGLDTLLQIGWDDVDLSLGEFISAGPDAVIDWLNHAVEHLAATAPAVEVNVHNHVGNYANLWVDYQGQEVFYYHLPQFADPRLGQMVHTLSVFDVYRPYATYGHPDFHLQHDYILKELPVRSVKYYPESAYWISADVDVPLFLPEYLYARWNDVHNLVREAREQGLPPLAGHVMFSSGHEWGYWLTDYLTAKMLWQPDEPLSTFLADYAGGFGTCANDVATSMAELVDLQNKYLFDARLLPYVQGENITVDLGYLAGKETHPKRISFEEVLAMSPADRGTFTTDIVTKLEAMVTETKPIEDRIATACKSPDDTVAPWCGELWDGIAIVRNRADHTAHLYRSILARADGKDAEADYKAATALTAEAAKIVARREKGYRFDLERLVGQYPNPTIYGFGYLRPSHSQCYWVRREMQVRELIDTGYPATIASLPQCQWE